MGGAGRRLLPLPRRKHPPLSAAGQVRQDDRESGARARESAQPDRRHCRDAFGVEDLVGAFTSFRRLHHAVHTLARHDALVPREYLAAMPLSLRIARRLVGSRERDDAMSPPGARLALALESLGPAYVKLGQVLATRPDLIGADVAHALESLQDRLPPFPTGGAKAAVETAPGKPLSEILASFSEPVAAASIAQVHEAQTTDEEPRKVAV